MKRLILLALGGIIVMGFTSCSISEPYNPYAIPVPFQESKSDQDYDSITGPWTP